MPRSTTTPQPLGVPVELQLLTDRQVRGRRNTAATLEAFDKSKVAVLGASMNLNDSAWLEADVPVDGCQHVLAPNATHRWGLIFQSEVVRSQLDVRINEAVLSRQNPSLVARDLDVTTTSGEQSRRVQVASWRRYGAFRLDAADKTDPPTVVRLTTRTHLPSMPRFNDRTPRAARSGIPPCRSERLAAPRSASLWRDRSVRTATVATSSGVRAAGSVPA